MTLQGVREKVVYIFGNGLSVGFEPDLALRRLSERVRARLGDRAEDLDAVAQLAYGDDPRGIVGVDRGNFETYAGPLDRIAEVVVAVDRLVGNRNVEITKTLRGVSDELRRLYLRLVGTVLREIDHHCVDQNGGEERIAAWQRMNAFARSLYERHCAGHWVTVFTLNYDSLLTSALLEAVSANGDYLYDGFRNPRGPLVLNEPLDRWREIALYHLHGSVAWRYDERGRVRKTELDALRGEGVLERWAAGDPSPGVPAVVLTDRKVTTVGTYPFSIFYEALDIALIEADAVVVGGYGFGDIPVNAALSHYLLADGQRRIRVWSPSASEDRASILALLRAYPHGGEKIGGHQLVTENVRLPDAEAVVRPMPPPPAPPPPPPAVLPQVPPPPPPRMPPPPATRK